MINTDKDVSRDGVFYVSTGQKHICGSEKGKAKLIFLWVIVASAIPET